MKETIKEKEIVQIAKNKGYFSVTWRYREDRLRNMCKNLCKKGLLYQASSNRGVDVFKAKSNN